MDSATRLYLNEAPPRRLMRATPGRFRFRRLDVVDSKQMVFELMDHLIADGRRNVLLTVSPVPLQLTFTGGDAVTANAYSKAVLRVVAEEAAIEFRSVDYFPSYESVTSAGLAPLARTTCMSGPALVSEIVGRMLTAYLEPGSGQRTAPSAA